MYFSHFTFFTVSCYTPVPKSLVFFLHVFQYFSPYFMSYHVNFSFSTFVSFLAIFKVQQCEFIISLLVSFLAKFQVLQCVCLILHIFQFSYQILVLQCIFLMFHIFHCFLPYSRSYSVHFSLFTFFSVSCNIPDTVCISHFPRFLVFFAIFQVKQCLCLFFHILKFSLHIPGPTVCISYSSRFSVFLAIF